MRNTKLVSPGDLRMTSELYLLQLCVIFSGNKTRVVILQKRKIMRNTKLISPGDLWMTSEGYLLQFVCIIGSGNEIELSLFKMEDYEKCKVGLTR